MLEVDLLDVLGLFGIDEFERIHDFNTLRLQWDIRFAIKYFDMTSTMPQTFEPLANVLLTKRLGQPHFRKLPALFDGNRTIENFLRWNNFLSVVAVKIEWSCRRCGYVHVVGIHRMRCVCGDDG